MAKNFLIKDKTAHDIDSRVERVLRGLGNPEPPLELEQVRELLKLDKAFYTADDPSIVRETVSRIRVATIQVFQRPLLLLEAIKKFSLQALYVPDSRRILLDANQPEKKHRWSEAHEVIHSLVPWHEDVMHGDNRHTLLPGCHDEVEAEANYGAGRLLFLRDRFQLQAMDQSLTIASVQKLHKDFGNTISSTLWRFVETVGAERPMVGMISCHPHEKHRPADFDPIKPCRHCIQSAQFEYNDEHDGFDWRRTAVVGSAQKSASDRFFREGIIHFNGSKCELTEKGEEIVRGILNAERKLDPDKYGKITCRTVGYAFPEFPREFPREWFEVDEVNKPGSAELKPSPSIAELWRRLNESDRLVWLGVSNPFPPKPKKTTCNIAIEFSDHYAVLYDVPSWAGLNNEFIFQKHPCVRATKRMPMFVDLKPLFPGCLLYDVSEFKAGPSWPDFTTFNHVRVMK